MDKMKMHTPNKADENFAKLAQLFPNAVTETIDENGEVVRAIDKDVLMQEISTKVVEGNEERYQFTWPDKKKSILLANAPIAKTLRPCREESVDFDNTENLYIEGDNLDVLKLLQETYLGKIKMIYIDPPYNTGSDVFVYDDDFSMSTKEFSLSNGNTDEDGNIIYDIRTNNDANGRFHTDWLNMLYPRLKLSRDLLTDNGVICISIDESEISNLRTLCDEIFGEDNFINTIAVKMSTASGVKLSHRDKTILKTKEYIVIYCKDKNVFTLNPQYVAKEKWDDYYEWFVDKKGDDVSKWKVSRLDEVLKENGIYDKSLDNPAFKTFYFENSDKIWQRGRNTSIPEEILAKSKENWETVFEYGDGEEKQYCYKGRRMAFLKNVLQECVDTTGKLNLDLGTLICDFWTNISTAALFAEGGVSFPNGKKPQLLLNILIRMFTEENDIILDYFSGSGSTAEATMKINFFQGFSHKFILVQLPEETEKGSDSYKEGFMNICEIGKERIRRAGAKIKEESPMTTSNLDTGFRVLKLDSTNMKDVYYNPADYELNLFDTLADNIKEDRTPEDLLFQVMLDLGVLLSSKIEESTIGGKKVFNVADGFLYACFDNNVTEDVITEIAKKQPYYFVMRDSSMANDSVATNFDQIFTTYSPDTVRKVL